MSRPAPEAMAVDVYSTVRRFGFEIKVCTEYDQQMDRAANQNSLKNRQLYLEEAERVMLDDHPVIPIYFYVSKHLVSPRVIGWEDNVLDYHYSQHLSLVTETK